MKLIVSERPKDSSECILKQITLSAIDHIHSCITNMRCEKHLPVKIKCMEECDTCKYIQTFEEYYNANNPAITNDGYDD